MSEQLTVLAASGFSVSRTPGGKEFIEVSTIDLTDRGNRSLLICRIPGLFLKLVGPGSDTTTHGGINCVLEADVITAGMLSLREGSRQRGGKLICDINNAPLRILDEQSGISILKQKAPDPLLFSGSFYPSGELYKPSSSSSY